MKEIKFWIMKFYYMPRLWLTTFNFMIGRLFVFRDQPTKFVQWVADRTLEKNPMFEEYILAAKDELEARARRESEIDSAS